MPSSPAMDTSAMQVMIYSSGGSSMNEEVAYNSGGSKGWGVGETPKNSRYSNRAVKYSNRTVTAFNLPLHVTESESLHLKHYPMTCYRIFLHIVLCMLFYICAF